MNPRLWLLTERPKRRKGQKVCCRPLPSLKSPSSLPRGAKASSGFIPSHGGYQKLLSFQKALVVYDATRYFCDRFFDRRDRTRDQMIQAARSGKQNILEGSQASGTSKETEIKLTNVARASLEELLEAMSLLESPALLLTTTPRSSVRLP